MDLEHPQPDRDKLASLTALVLIAYSLVRIAALPTLSFQLTFLGVLLRIELNTRLVMLTLSAALTASGADWLVASHPSIILRRRAEHWVVPALAALALGGIITRLPSGLPFAVGLGMAALCLLAVLVAEFHVVDPSDPGHDAASVGLRVLSYVLLVGVLFTLRATGARAAFAVPIVLAAVTAISWRLLRLEEVALATWPYALGVGWISAQAAWALHYWPMAPIQEALVLCLLVYEALQLLRLHLHDQIRARQLVELGVLGFGSLTAILLLA